MTIRLNGATSGYTEIDAPAVAGSNTLVLPTSNGSADQALVTNGSGTLSFADRGRMTLATAQNSTSGTSIDFTGIPSWVKRVTVMFQGVSTNGTSDYVARLGTASGIESTSYIASNGYTAQSVANTTKATAWSSGFGLSDTVTAVSSIHGLLTICNISGNSWVASFIGIYGSGSINYGGGSKTLSGTLTQLRITTVNGTDTFDAGSINILYEG
jgi:hypothetical protein